MGSINKHNYEAYLLDLSEGTISQEDYAALICFSLNHPELGIDLNTEPLPALSNESIDTDFKTGLFKGEHDLTDYSIIQYLEGQLEAAEIIEFETMLHSSQELKELVESYKKTKLSAEEQIVFIDKTLLLKSEEDVILENRAIAFFENQLDVESAKAFERQILTNQHLITEFELIKKTKLYQDQAIHFPDKDRLYKNARTFNLFDLRTVSAIAAGLVLCAGFIFLYNHFSDIKQEKNGLANVETLSQKTNGLLNREHKISSQTEQKPISNITIPIGSKIAVKSSSKKTGILSLINSIEQIEELSDLNINTVAFTGEIEDKPRIIAQDLIVSNQSELADNYGIAELMEVTDEDEVSRAADKKNFWGRTLALAKGINKLGLHSIDVEDQAQNRFRLSVFGLTVERK